MTPVDLVFLLEGIGGVVPPVKAGDTPQIPRVGGTCVRRATVVTW